MKGFNTQVTGGVAKAISLSPLEQFTHLKICNRTGGILYALAASEGTPSSSNAHFVISDAADMDFTFDNTAQAPSDLQVISAGTGYVHFVGW